MKDNENSYRIQESHDIKYLREQNPDVYKKYKRNCLRCDAEFYVYHKYTRVCYLCKENSNHLRYVTKNN